MCTPIDPFTVAQKAVTSAQGIYTMMENKQNAKYRIQASISNAQNAANEALRQRQLGIENARKEKLEGMKESGKLAAKNASNGFDIYSDTNNYNMQSITDSANAQAQEVDKKYNRVADDYYNRANEYLRGANQYRKQYNSSVWDEAFAVLGSTNNVAKNWYSKKE